MDSRSIPELFKEIPATIPSEWGKCSPISDGVIGNLFVVFKCPLGQKYKLDECELRFTPQMVFDTVEIQGHGRIKLWINLTSTKYYEINEITDNSAEYCQLHTPGLKEHADGPPSDEDVVSFFEKCYHFLKNRESPSELIGVHSTLGYNRAGYFICAYLGNNKTRGLDVVDALQEYREKRPNGMHNQMYIDNLLKRFGLGSVPASLIAPKQPQWLPPRNRKEIKKNPTFFVTTPLIACIEADSSIAARVLKQIQDICHWKEGGFPGRSLVTLGMDKMHYLEELNYYVSLKEDGRRYMFFIDDNCEAFFMDREAVVFSLCTRPSSTSPPQNGWLASTVNGLRHCLLDGELLVDRFGNPTLLIFDVLQHRDKNFVQSTFATRQDYLRKAGILDALAELDTDLKFELSSFVDMAELESVFGLIDESGTGQGARKFECDGIVFENKDEKYVTGSADTVLKWKPFDQSTVDFRLEIDLHDRLVGKLFVTGLSAHLGKITINKQLEQLDGRIIECYRENDEWIFMRERPERINPNAYNTAMEVVSNILRPVTKEYLIQFVKEVTQKKKQKKDEEKLVTN